MSQKPHFLSTQGDPLSPYLFIICLEVLAISIRSDKQIQGILVDDEEIKLEIFADDLTLFLRNQLSLNPLFNIIQQFTLCSGLEVNYDKTEVILLGNQKNASKYLAVLNTNIKVKKAVKILGIHFTYDRGLWRKLNFDEILKSIKEKLQFWNWRNLTILGRIQIVKTFVIPIFMYRAGLVCVNKDVIKEANKIIFQFIWKGKDKVKRSTLIGDVENGGLKAPHLESIVKTQRIMCCKKLAEAQPSSWKLIFLHYLKPVGGKLLLACDFDVKKLPIRLPEFYEECLKCFAEISVGSKMKNNQMKSNDVASVIIWNNKNICIDGRSIYHSSLYEKGMVRLEDLVDDKNNLIVRKKMHSDLSPLEIFFLMRIIDALPPPYRNSLTNNAHNSRNAFVLTDHFVLRLNNQNVALCKTLSKSVYREIRSNFECAPTARAKFEEKFGRASFKWNEIYSLPFTVALNTKTREFQYKILNRYLVTNTFLHKVGLKPSALCTFCGEESESLEHLFISCCITERFWLEFIHWCNNIHIKLEKLSEVDKLVGIWDRKEDFLLLNHLLIIARQNIYDCRSKLIHPSLRLFISKVNYIYQIEVKTNNFTKHESSFNLKWTKYITSLSAS